MGFEYLKISVSVGFWEQIPMDNKGLLILVENPRDLNIMALSLLLIYSFNQLPQIYNSTFLPSQCCTGGQPNQSLRRINSYHSNLFHVSLNHLPPELLRPKMLTCHLGLVPFCVTGILSAMLLKELYPSYQQCPQNNL